jgi:Mrp family chromosome partitioning ATPase
MCDLVIVDSTPLLTVSDSLPLVEVVSGVVVIARVNETSKDAVKRLSSVISTAGGTLLGAVATGVTSTAGYGGYGYGYGQSAPSSNGASRTGAFHPRKDGRPAAPAPPSPPAAKRRLGRKAAPEAQGETPSPIARPQPPPARRRGRVS